MKTAHQIAKQLLTGPDLPIFHFDPSRAGTDDERDTSISEPTLHVVSVPPTRGQRKGKDFITIEGDTDPFGEAMSETEIDTRNVLRAANDLCRSMAEIVNRRGKSTNWDAFGKQLSEQLQIQRQILHPNDAPIPSGPLMGEALAAIIAERRRQDRKWGAQRDLADGTWLQILVEEVGEVAEAMLEKDKANLIVELTQVAAVAVAMVEAIYVAKEKQRQASA